MPSTPVPPRGGKGNKGQPRKPAGRQAAQAAANRRRRTMIAGISVGVVVVVVAVLVIVGLSSKSSTKAAPRTLLTSAQLQQLESVPLDNLVAAAPRVTGLLSASTTNQASITDHGKPELLYIGAEFCPYCATERWPLMVALSQFGTFKNVSQTRSAVTDGNIPTLSFFGSSYSSPYLSFVPVENETNSEPPKPLQQPTTAESALWKSIDTSATGSCCSYPFLDIGGQVALLNAQFSDTTLEGTSFNEIFNDVGNNSTTIGADIDASAAVMTKYICGITKNQPAKVCDAVASVTAPVSSSASSGSSSSASG